MRPTSLSGGGGDARRWDGARLAAPPGRRGRIPVVLLLLLFVGTGGAAAQERTPLQKTDLIRLLTSPTYTRAEVAEIVRRNCLTFSPTARDRSDLRALGADSGILSAIDGCERRAEAPTIALGQRSYTVTAGGTAAISVVVRRGAEPASGIRLLLRGSGAIPGGPELDAEATTDGNGRATFRVFSGNAAATYTLRVVGDPTPVQGAAVIRLTAAPGAPSRADVTPERILAGASAQHALRLRIRDPAGNPIAGREVVLRGGDSAAPALGSASTDDRGEAALDLPDSALTDLDSIDVVVADRVLARVPIVHETPGEEGTGFAAGTEQRGDAGETLPAPLVFQVAAPNGEPIANRLVRFRVVNGSVSPEIVATDERGRVEVRLTLGEAGRPTELVASVAGLERRVSFDPTIGGLTLAQFRTALADAARLLDLGDHAGARQAYERLLAADSGSVDARVGYGRVLERAGEPAAAAASYRTALRLSPGREDAQLGLARVSLAVGDPVEAARRFETVTRSFPGTTAAWVGLGDARAAAGDEDGARAAWERALALDPSLDDVRRRLAPRSGALVAELELWGGNTFDNGRSFGPRAVEARVWPTPRLGLFGGFDNALNLRHPYLVRGPDDIREYYGGFSGEWGPSGRLLTRGHFGRRRHTPDLTIQTIWLLEQGVRVRDDVAWKVGGLLGHWFDRDDWVVFTGVEFAPAPGVRVAPLLSYGDHAGSNIGVTGREAEREVRFAIEGEYESVDGWGVIPRVGVGSVSADVEEFEGSVFEGELRAWVRFARTSRVEFLVRGQSSPGAEAFTTVALGVRLGLERSRR